MTNILIINTIPDGDKQEIEHSLKFGDLVDINGNVYQQNQLDPFQITYRVSKINNRTYFKETSYYYQLELMNRDEVNDEIFYKTSIDFKNKIDERYEKIIKKMEKKYNRNNK